MLNNVNTVAKTNIPKAAVVCSAVKFSSAHNNLFIYSCFIYLTFYFSRNIHIEIQIVFYKGVLVKTAAYKVSQTNNKLKTGSKLHQGNESEAGRVDSVVT